MTPDLASVYRGSRERTAAMVSEAGEAAVDGTVPSCPEWTPKDVVAHLAGVCADILAGNIKGAGTDPWTQVQVADRQGRSLDEVMAEWQELGPKVEEILSLFPEDAALRLLADTLTHEYDLAEAFGRKPQAPAGLEPVLDFCMRAFVANAERDGAPPLAVEIGDQRWEASSGEQPAELKADPVEMLRALTGRRTADEVRAYDWGGADASAWLGAFEVGHFKLRDSPIPR